MIRAENIGKRYEGVDALKGISLELSKGEILAVMGPSGCGKTTLLRVVAGLETLDEGRVSIGGELVSTATRMVPPYKRRLSMIFQDLALWPHMTVEENISFVFKKNGLSAPEMRNRVQRMLDEVSLGGHNRRYPHNLSGGERQRLAIARAIAPDPDYLLMDEPFSSLDPLLKEELQTLVLDLRDRRRMGILYVSHNAGEVVALADRIAIMKKGEIEQIGSTEEILSHPKNDMVRRFFKLG